MREIKFRGKLVNGTNEWVYGTPVRRIPGWVFDQIITDGFSVNAERLVDPTTVGQFTGCVDRDGKEIYEGDIVKWEEYVADSVLETRVYEVYYHGQVGFWPMCEIFIIKHLDGKLGRIPKMRCELLGNIWDNRN